MQSAQLRQKIKEMMVEELMLEIEPADIDNNTPIFGGEGLGLDSVDALQLVVGLEKHFGLKVENSSDAKTILATVETIATEIKRTQGSQG